MLPQVCIHISKQGLLFVKRQKFDLGVYHKYIVQQVGSPLKDVKLSTLNINLQEFSIGGFSNLIQAARLNGRLVHDANKIFQVHEAI